MHAFDHVVPHFISSLRLGVSVSLVSRWKMQADSLQGNKQISLFPKLHAGAPCIWPRRTNSCN